MPKTTLRDVARNLSKPAPKVLTGKVLTAKNEPARYDRSYPFTGSDGETVNVYVLGAQRWYYDDGGHNEVIRHEIAHALCSHGRHDLEWWDKLIDIGGRGVWVNEWGTVEQAHIIVRGV